MLDETTNRLQHALRIPTNPKSNKKSGAVNVKENSRARFIGCF